MKKEILKGVIISVSFTLTTLVTIIAYGAWINISNQTNGTTINATIWNDLVNNMNTIGAKVDTLSNIPTGFIGAFHLTTCPSGWIPADGSNGTPDLRGQFLRGINSFDNGVTTRTDGKQDLDCSTRSSGSCSVGSYQSDEFKSHVHKQHDATMYNYTPKYFNTLIGAGVDVNLGVYMSFNTNATGGNETRGKNVGVIFCVKQ